MKKSLSHLACAILARAHAHGWLPSFIALVAPVLVSVHTCLCEKTLTVSKYGMSLWRRSCWDETPFL